MKTCAAVLSCAVVIQMFLLSLGSVCKFELLSPSVTNDGFVTSPDYPSFYPPDVCIVWLYYGTPGTRIHISFLDVDIPGDFYWCSNDFLKIGPINETFYCGNYYSYIFNPYTAMLSMKVTFLHIVFNSTNVVSKGRGFKIYYQIYIAEDNHSIDKTTTSTTSVWYQPDKTSTTCNYEITDSSGYIRSDDFSLYNQNSVYCIWHLHFPKTEGHQIKYYLIIDISKMSSHSFLKIYDGPNTNALLLREYHYYISSSVLWSSKNDVIIYYRPAGSTWGSNDRFTVYYQVKVGDSEKTVTGQTMGPFVTQCNLQLTDHSGEIKISYLTSDIKKPDTCFWLLHASVKERERVTYTLKIDVYRFASNSTLHIYDGPSMNAPLLWTYFQPTQTISLRSLEDNVFIYYTPGVNSEKASDDFTIIFNTDEQCAPGYVPCGYGEPGCYDRVNRCDVTWHCPLEGGDERGCSSECPNMFSCGNEASCYDESDRCSGRGICLNKIDEKNCTIEQCSSNKGLYLCRNRYCIHDSLRCNKINDCFDNSDEDGCFTSISPFIVIATAASCLMCTLIVVIVIGCACQLHRRRALHLRGPVHDTPLSRQLSEILEQQAPPPSYHEAILTSRPYCEDYSEMHHENENQTEPDLFNSGYPENSDLSFAWEQTQRNNHENGRGFWNSNTENGDQGPVFRLRTEPNRQADAFDLFSDLDDDDDVLCEDIAEENPPTYANSVCNETNASFINILNTPDVVPESSHDGTNHEVFDNAAFTGDDYSEMRTNGDSVIQMCILSNITQSPEISQTSAISRDPVEFPSSAVSRAPVEFPSLAIPNDLLNFQSSVSELQHLSCNNKGDRDNDLEYVSAATDNDTPQAELKERDGGLKDDMNVEAEDSDSDCILAYNDDTNDDYDDITKPDTACILAHV